MTVAKGSTGSRQFVEYCRKIPRLLRAQLTEAMEVVPRGRLAT